MIYLKKITKKYKLSYLNSKYTNKNPCESTRHLIHYINVANYIIFIIMSLLLWNIKYYITKVDVGFGPPCFVYVIKDKACGFLIFVSEWDLQFKKKKNIYIYIYVGTRFLCGPIMMLGSHMKDPSQYDL